MHRPFVSISTAALSFLFLLAAPVAAETRDKVVKTNTRSAIGGFFSYGVGTCLAGVIPNAKIRKQGANGTIEIQQHEQVLGKDTQCPGTNVRGLVFIYTPAKGFRGTDEVAIDLPWAGNDSGQPTILTNTYRIRVE
jgi:hypothetical protein